MPEDSERIRETRIAAGDISFLSLNSNLTYKCKKVTVFLTCASVSLFSEDLAPVMTETAD